MTRYDQDRDGSLSASELDRCPSLKTLLKSLGKGPDGKIGRDELLQRIRDIQLAKAKGPSVPCVVTLDGSPLADATITFTLEPFHGSTPSTASGKSGADGRAEVNSPDGVLNGFYRVSVSKLIGGIETVPARYNSDSVLGAEVSPHSLGRGGTLEIALHNR